MFITFSMKAQTYRNVIDARTPADQISSHFNLQPRAHDTQNRKEKWTERMNNENKNKLWQYSISAGPLLARNLNKKKNSKRADFPSGPTLAPAALPIKSTVCKNN